MNCELLVERAAAWRVRLEATNSAEPSLGLTRGGYHIRGQNVSHIDGILGRKWRDHLTRNHGQRIEDIGTAVGALGSRLATLGDPFEMINCSATSW
jgi:hypothetical protein